MRIRCLISITHPSGVLSLAYEQNIERPVDHVLTHNVVQSLNSPENLKFKSNFQKNFMFEQVGPTRPSTCLTEQRASEYNSYISDK